MLNDMKTTFLHSLLEETDFSKSEQCFTIDRLWKMAKRNLSYRKNNLIPFHECVIS